MPRRNRLHRWLIVAGFLVLVAGVSAFVLQANKYYVKRVIKEHAVLYAAAKRIALMKHDVLLLLSHDDRQQAEDAFMAKYANRNHWRLGFDFSVAGTPFQCFWGDLGYESFTTVLSGKNRRLFRLMKEANMRTKGAFRYIRAHNIYGNGKPPWGEGLNIYSEDAVGNPLYDWTLTDKVFDEIIRFGFRPIIEFGFMPDALASIPHRRQRWLKANISPPKDYRKWQELVRATVAHLRDRYGENEIAKWYFEVWNEPDLGRLFWIEAPGEKSWGDLNEYAKLYDYAVAGAKSACPAIRVGGPASAGLGTGFFLEHAVLGKNYASGRVGTPVDFISSHAYGLIRALEKGKKEVIDGIRLKVARAREHDHKDVRRKMQHLPFLLTETGPSVKNGKFYNSRYMAAWWAKMVDGVFYLKDVFGEAYAPDELVAWSTEQLAKRFTGSWGVAAYLGTGNGLQVVKRPSFNIFELLGHLSNSYVPLQAGSEFRAPVHAFATRDGDRSVEIVVYHLDERDRENASADSQAVRLSLENLPFTQYAVSCYSIDGRNSNGYSAWKELGEPKRLTQRQARWLDRRDDLQLAEPVRNVRSLKRKFTKNFKMQPNSVMLFVLKRNSDVK